MGVVPKLKIKKPNAHDSAGFGDEPTWVVDVMSLSLPQYTYQTMHAVNWYYQFYNKKEMQEWFATWYQYHFPKRTRELKYINVAKPDAITNLMGCIYAMELKGWRARYPVLKSIVNTIRCIIADTETHTAKQRPTAVVTHSIQDRTKDIAVEMCEELEVAIDQYIKSPSTFDPKPFKVISTLRNKGVKASHAKYIKDFYAVMFAEYAALLSTSCDEQLSESYASYGRKNIKKMYDFLTSINTACDQIIDEKKAMRQERAKKVKPVGDLVKHIKFRATDDKMGVSSMSPTSIIGALSVVVFNTKTKKIGLYIAKTPAGLSVKGTSIIEFTDGSVQRTLRKPASQLLEFKEQSTQRKFNTWFAKIETTETTLTGRMTDDIMILKIYK